MKAGALLALLAGALAVAGDIVVPATADANATSCSAGTHGSKGYAYAGHQAVGISHGVRATISTLEQPSVAAGHVAGWIGVGGPGQGPNGEAMWLQAGIASIPGTPTMVYAEITRAARDPVFIPLVENVQLGERHRLAVLEMPKRQGVWRIWLDGQAVTSPIVLPGSHDRWRPIATAESWNGRTATCNTFGFRFERVGVATANGGSWQTFVPGFTFQDRGYTVRELRPAGSGQRTVSSSGIASYAFEAASL